MCQHACIRWCPGPISLVLPLQCCRRDEKCKRYRNTAIHPSPLSLLVSGPSIPKSQTASFSVKRPSTFSGSLDIEEEVLQEPRKHSIASLTFPFFFYFDGYQNNHSVWLSKVMSVRCFKILSSAGLTSTMSLSGIPLSMSRCSMTLPSFFFF